MCTGQEQETGFAASPLLGKWVAQGHVLWSLNPQATRTAKAEPCPWQKPESGCGPVVIVDLCLSGIMFCFVLFLLLGDVPY